MNENIAVLYHRVAEICEVLLRHVAADESSGGCIIGMPYPLVKELMGICDSIPDFPPCQPLRIECGTASEARAELKALADAGSPVLEMAVEGKCTSMSPYGVGGETEIAILWTWTPEINDASVLRYERSDFSQWKEFARVLRRNLAEWAIRANEFARANKPPDDRELRIRELVSLMDENEQLEIEGLGTKEGKRKQVYANLSAAKQKQGEIYSLAKSRHDAGKLSKSRNG